MSYSKEECDDIIEIVRLELYNQEAPCGPRPIRERMEELGVTPLPSERSIARVLKIRGLTHRRTGIYPGEEAIW